MYRRFASIDPLLMTAAIVACFVAAGGLDGSSATLALAAGICFGGMLAITLVGNMPINVRVLRWDEERGDPGEWRRIRRRWDRIHTVALAAVGAAEAYRRLCNAEGPGLPVCYYLYSLEGALSDRRHCLDAFRQAIPAEAIGGNES